MKLTNTQMVILSAAAERDDGSIYPLPKTLKGGAITKVTQALLRKGLIAEAPGREDLRDATYIECLRPTLDRMVRDPSPAVLSCVAGTLRAVAYHHPARGLQLFRDMDFSEEGLLATQHVCAFIRDGIRSTFSDLRPMLERMLRSSEPKVCEAGTRLASLAFLADQNAADLVDEALHGRPCQRLGVAQVAAANIIFPECRRWSKESLRLLFNDTSVRLKIE